MNKIITTTALFVSTVLFAQGASAASFNFVRLPDANGSTSVSVINDGITATATTTSPDGLGVSFNQGLGVLNGGLKTAVNNGDRIDITFDQAVDVELVGMRQWGEGIGGDSANIISTSGTQFLSGGGDQGNGAVDLFTIGLTNTTGFSIVGLGNVDNAAIGDFFLGQLDNVFLATNTPDSPETPTVPSIPDTSGIPNVPAAVPVPGAVWLFGSGLLGLVGHSRKKSVKATM